MAKQAEVDIKAAEWNEVGKFYEDAFFLAQQSVEKILKAFLYSKGERELIGHSTLVFIDQCSKYISIKHELKNICRNLDKFYIPTRYPDSLPDGIPHDYFVEEDSLRAIKDAKEIINFFKKQIK